MESHGSKKNPERLADLTQDDRNYLVELNSRIANTIRYPKTDYEAHDVSRTLNNPLSSKGLIDGLDDLRKYEFDYYDQWTVPEYMSHKAAETFAKEMDGDKITLHDLFDKVNQKYNMSEVIYTGNVPYYKRTSQKDVQDAAAFVHDHDTLDNVYKRSDKNHVKAEKEYGITEAQFSKFSNLERGFRLALYDASEKDFPNLYKEYESTKFQSADALIKYLDKYKRVFNDDQYRQMNDAYELDSKFSDLIIDQESDRILDDNDVKAFAKFAIRGLSDDEKANGVSLKQVLSAYDKTKVEYLENMLSKLQTDVYANPAHKFSAEYEDVRNIAAERKHFTTVQSNTMSGKQIGLVVNRMQPMDYTDKNGNTQSIVVIDAVKRGDVAIQHNKFDGCHVVNRKRPNGSIIHGQAISNESAKKILEVNGYPDAKREDFAKIASHQSLVFNANVFSPEHTPKRDFAINPKPELINESKFDFDKEKHGEAVEKVQKAIEAAKPKTKSQKIKDFEVNL